MQDSRMEEEILNIQQIFPFSILPRRLCLKLPISELFWDSTSLSDPSGVSLLIAPGSLFSGLSQLFLSHLLYCSKVLLSPLQLFPSVVFFLFIIFLSYW